MERRIPSPAGRSRTDSFRPPSRSAESAGPRRGAAPGASFSRSDLHLVQRAQERCGRFIAQACAGLEVPAEFLAALVANESGGDLGAARFEPSVYRHLKAVADGVAPVYGGIRAGDLADEVEEMLHPKTGNFHQHFLTERFAASHSDRLASLEDEALRELATSWGYTQIMGYHMVGRGAPRDLLEPLLHFRVAIELLTDFAAYYRLDVRREFAEMFRCWNTGAPYGETFDPRYVETGLRRLEVYRAISREART